METNRASAAVKNIKSSDIMKEYAAYQNTVVNVQTIKMDALWKPIIRKFRQFIKIKVMHKLRYQVDDSLHINVLGKLFGEILKVPEELLGETRT